MRLSIHSAIDAAAAVALIATLFMPFADQRPQGHVRVNASASHRTAIDASHAKGRSHGKPAFKEYTHTARAN